MTFAPDNSTVDALTAEQVKDRFPLECAKSSRILGRAAQFLTLDHLPESQRSYMQQSRIVANTAGRLETEKLLADAILQMGTNGYAEFNFKHGMTVGIAGTDLNVSVQKGYLRVLEDTPGKGCVVAATDKLVKHLSQFKLFQDPSDTEPAPALNA